MKIQEFIVFENIRIYCLIKCVPKTQQAENAPMSHKNPTIVTQGRVFENTIIYCLINYITKTLQAENAPMSRNNPMIVLGIVLYHSSNYLELFSLDILFKPAQHVAMGLFSTLDG
ncbi:unnamed protein product [Camellia sinensis]